MQINRFGCTFIKPKSLLVVRVNGSRMPERAQLTFATPIFDGVREESAQFRYESMSPIGLISPRYVLWRQRFGHTPTVYKR